MRLPTLSISSLVYLGVLLFSLTLIAFDLHWRFDEIQKTTAFGRSANLDPHATLAPGTHERAVILPVMSTDTRWWIMHTEQMMENRAWRVRHTASDNAPAGREVHWSSPPMWLMAGLASAFSAFQVFPAADSVQWAAVFVGPAWLALLLVGLSILAARAFGPWPAAVLCLGLIGCWPLYQFFRAGEGDHHGLVSCASMASLLCLLAAGAGAKTRPSGKSRPPADTSVWPTPSSAHRWATASGILGAVGLWISSASQIPVLVGSGAAALLLTFLSRRARTWTVDPELWRVWGFSGALASLAFYLLEYFPSHLGLRLEVNNPVYALAWAGGGELLCRFSRILSGTAPLSRNRTEILTLLLSFIACAIPVILVAFYKEHVFRVSDRFLYNLHSYYIAEFQNFWSFQRTFKDRLQLLDFLALPVFTLVAALILLVTRHLSSLRFVQVLAALGPIAILQAMAFSQVRWGGNAAALWIVLLVVCTAAVVDLVRTRSLKLPVTLAFATLLLLSTGIYPLKSYFSWQERRSQPDGVDRDFLPTILRRDIAHRLIRNYRSGTPVVLSGPDTTTELTYFGGVRGLGTLYWENLDGLRSASQIYAAKTARETLDLLRQYGVTHMIFFSWDSFAQRYVRLARDLGRDTEAKDGYIATLLEGRQAQPLWLRPVYYPMDQLGLKDTWVRIYEVVPDQTPAQWHYHVGLYQLQAAQLAPAEQNFRKALEADPAYAEAAGTLAALYLSGNRDNDALTIVNKTLARNGAAAAPVFEEMIVGLEKSQPDAAAKVTPILIAYFEKTGQLQRAEDLRRAISGR